MKPFAREDPFPERTRPVWTRAWVKGPGGRWEGGVVVGEGPVKSGGVVGVNEKIFVAAVGSGDGGKGPGFDVVRGVG